MNQVLFQDNDVYIITQEEQQRVSSFSSPACSFKTVTESDEDAAMDLSSAQKNLSGTE